MIVNGSAPPTHTSPADADVDADADAATTSSNADMPIRHATELPTKEIKYSESMSTDEPGTDMTIEYAQREPPINNIPLIVHIVDIARQQSNHKTRML
jgi:hypothetical protein